MNFLSGDACQALQCHCYSEGLSFGILARCGLGIRLGRDSQPLTRKENDMKNRALTLVALLLSAALALPALAQQSGSGAPPAVTGVSGGSSTQTGTQTTRQDFWEGDEPSLGSLIFHPFASKEYVRRHMQSIRDRVNELDELTTANQRAIKDVDARAQQGIRLASDKASLADDHANDATTKAQMAQQTATILNTRVTNDERVVGSLDQYKAGAQTEIRFRPGQNVLSKDAKDALDQIASQVKSQRGYIIEVQGFSAGHGQMAIAHSKTVADAVVRYLVLNHEVPSYRIYVIGMGNASEEKHVSGSRVEVSLLKNDLEQTAKQ